MVKTTRSAALRLRLVVTEHQENMGRRIRERREALGLSRDEVARRMGALAAERGEEVDKTNGNALYRYEIGEVTPGARKLDLLAGALGVPVAYFLMDAPAEGTPDLVGALKNSDSDEILSTLKQLVERQEAVEAALADLAEAVVAMSPQAQREQRRAAGS